jgi:SpoVK/Ycf46/Vps4 family AAA+-type ATPase
MSEDTKLMLYISGLSVNDLEIRVSQSDFTSAAQTLKPSVSEEEFERYEAIERNLS